jgi:thiamine kinase-like enzyme
MPIIEETLKQIVGEFFPDKRLQKAEIYGTGNINDTYRIILEGSSKDGYLLQRINREVFREPEKVMQNILAVSEHLLAADPRQSCVLQPIPASNKLPWHLDEQGEYWRCFPFFSNTFSPESVENTKQAFQAAATIGRFLFLLMDLDPSNLHITIPDFHNSLKRAAHFREVLEKDPQNRRGTAEAEIVLVREHLMLFEEIAGLDIPRRVVHNDTKISNVLFDRHTGAPRCLIDWDTIMPGTILSDFGDMVRSFASPVPEDDPGIEKARLDLDVFEAVCRGFIPAVATRLTEVEKKWLVKGAPWITLEQALRFLTDYLEGDLYYKTLYAAHNLIRTRNQLSLFRSMSEQEKRMKLIAARFF